MTRSLRVAFLGNAAWSVPSLEAVVASAHAIVAVLTAPPKPAGRGNELRSTPVADAARAAGLPIEEVETVAAGHGFKMLAASTPDVIAVVAYGEILLPNVLRLPTIAPVNVHFSLLPELRGASPVQTALLLGLATTGVSTIVMDRGLDTGPVILQRRESIAPDDDGGTLGARLARIGGALLVESLDLLAAGPVALRPQDHTLATFAPKFGPQDRVIDWANPARVLVNLVRALAPEPAATTTFRDAPVKILRAEAVAATGEPGMIVAVSHDGPIVATSDGGVRPLVVVPSGRRAMSGADLVNGLRLAVGERFG
ncbi:MAG TPA: methionyl-tRNA formyltransferase [Actinomycetota bacterium]|nr:methionyl-tRNA formyltransferase [Actinomycetota bacterium]